MKKIFLFLIVFAVLVACKQKNEVISVQEIKLSFTELTLAPGETELLSVDILPSNASNKKIVWKSSNSKVAEVTNNGQVKAISLGTATITANAEDGNKSAECNITVFSADTEVNGVKFEFVSIKPGTFMLGSPETEAEREKDETLHKVALDGFYLGKYEVTQAQWKAVMGADNNPSKFVADTLPVEQVSWNMAQEFIIKLNTLTNKKYRLPTEAEWEYACRAGTDTPFGTGNNITTDEANYDGHYPYNKNPKGVNRQKTTKIGKFAPNPWGLYDMHGNVYEWCSDWYGRYPEEDQTNPTGASAGEFKVLRGGSYYSMGRDLRSAFRYYIVPNADKSFIGFRIALSKK